MDSFINGVQSHTIDLCVIDLIPSFCNVPFYFYYKNTGGDHDFMPSELLRESFYVSLLDFPILAGRLVTVAPGHIKVVVDKENLNLPEYRESQSDVHFSELQATKFGCKILPGGVATVSSVTTAGADGTIKLANIHIVRLHENSGVVVFASIAHYIVDGTGYCQFISRWAEVCKWMQRRSVAGELPAFSAGFLRSTIYSHLPVERKELDEGTKAMMSTQGLLSRWLAWISPEFRGSVLSLLPTMASGEGHAFHISTRALASLHTMVKDYIPGDERISDNDILTALISMLVAQCESLEMSASSKKGYLASLGAYLLPSMFTTPVVFSTQVVVDLRPRLEGLGSAKYSGNSVVTQSVNNPTQSMCGAISGQTLAQVARSVRRMVSGTDAAFLGQLVEETSKKPEQYTNILAHVLTTPSLVVSNISRFAFYGVDFGGGIPAYVCPLVRMLVTFAVILPVHPSLGGYGIHITMTKQAMARLLMNEFWMDIVELLY
ncbi:hypothetical protein H4R26_004846 [Coemansia thaxteri]|uniref:Uncharacterized protein n=1 Tax=Coemansia thaxteri TaxID=2663907 RepID=A0A9W8BAB6_9FUNG|nr:hypothetical protein H4R26_004846 [Coemansia thaxteri]